MTSLLLLLSLSLLTLGLLPTIRTPLIFMYNCFIKPFVHKSSSNKEKHVEQKDRLDEFYSGQADVYDTTRTHLLKGRETMLQLLASHLKAQPQAQGGNQVGGAQRRPKIWVDIGGGTGWNIEKM
jgi:betaine lipid synthase